VDGRRAWELHQAGWSQRRIAAEVGVPRRTVGDWLGGLRQVSETAQAEDGDDGDGAESDVAPDVPADPEPEASTSDAAREAETTMRYLEVRIGELLGPAQLGGDRRSDQFAHSQTDLEPRRLYEFRQMAAHPEVVDRSALAPAACPVAALCRVAGAVSGLGRVRVRPEGGGDLRPGQAGGPAGGDGVGYGVDRSGAGEPCEAFEPADGCLLVGEACGRFCAVGPVAGEVVGARRVRHDIDATDLGELLAGPLLGRALDNGSKVPVRN
jgi:hypothetical protein